MVKTFPFFRILLHVKELESDYCSRFISPDPLCMQQQLCCHMSYFLVEIRISIHVESPHSIPIRDGSIEEGDQN